MAKKDKSGKKRNAIYDKIDELQQKYPEFFDSLLEAFHNMPDSRPIVPVTENEWALTHPFQLKTGSDRFYADLANTIQRKLSTVPLPLAAPSNLIRELSMTLAAYLEDVVNEIGVWQAVRNLYRRQYGSWLPFFDCEHGDFYIDDLNIEDIKVLVWQTFCRCGQPKGTTYSPLSDAVTRISELAFDLLVDHFEKAPQNSRIATRIREVMETADYYRLRSLGLWLGTDNKLTSVPGMRDAIMKRANEFLNSGKGFNLEVTQAYYMSETIDGWKDAISMLGCPTNVLLSQLAGDYGYDHTSNLLNGLEVRIFDNYSVEKINSKAIVLKDIAGTEFLFDPKSLTPGTKISDVKTFIGAIVKFGDMWQQNGMGAFRAELLKPKEGPQEAVNIPACTKKIFEEVVRKNLGRRVYYCKDTTEISNLISNGMSPVPISNGVDAEFEQPDNFVVMINDSKMPDIFPGICGIFSDRHNPFYNAKEEREWLADESLRLILTGRISDEVATYIQEKHIMPNAEINASQGKRVGKSIVQNNLRFLFGFYRVEVPDTELSDDGSEN